MGGQRGILSVDSMVRRSTVASDDLDLACIRSCDGLRDPRDSPPARPGGFARGGRSRNRRLPVAAG